MSDEELKQQEAGATAPTSEETKPEIQPEEKKEETLITPEAGNEDQLAELKKQVENLQTEVGKKDKDLNQIGFRYRKIKEKAEAEGIDVESLEKEQGLTAEQIDEMISKRNNELLDKINLRIGEVAKAISSKPGSPSGSPGQKKESPKGPLPQFTPQMKAYYDSLGLSINSEKRVVQDQAGKVWGRIDENGDIIPITPAA